MSLLAARFVCVAALAATAAFSSACATRGSGKEATEDRVVEAFHGVDVGGVFTLEATEGSPASVQLEGDANLLPLIETRVEGGILKVSTKQRVAPELALVVRVRTPELKEVDVSGAANATITTAQPSFELDVSGASEAVVSGSSRDFDLDASGASDVDARALAAEHVHVDASGASHADVTAKQSLDAEASGASEITWGGGATDVKEDKSGASSIVRRGP